MNIIRKISLTMVAILFATIANAYNFTIANVSGKQGETKTVSVGLINETTDITAFAGEFVVPAGLEFVFDEAVEEYDFTLSDRKNTTHVFSSAKQTNGNIMVTCYSTKNKCFTGTSGELFSGQLKLTGAPGTYTVKLINAYVTSDAAKDFTCADVTFTVTIEDDTPQGTYGFAISDVNGTQNSTATVSVSLNNETTDITAFAGEFVVPAGLEFVFDEALEEYDFTLSDRKNTTHVFSSAKQTNGNIMVTCYSTKNKCFTGTSGELFSGQLKLAGAPGTYTIKLINAYVTSDAAKDFTCADVTFTVTIEEEDVATAAADKFKTDNANILGKTTENVTSSDLTAINKALDDYNQLSEAAKIILSSEKTLLDNLKTKVESIKTGILESGSCGENVTYILYNDGNLVISGSGDMADYFSTAPWDSNISKIKKVLIENGVTSIGERALSTCSNLASITIPNSVTSIGFAAFYNCSSLSSVTIPNSVKNIEEGAFYCSGLTSVTIPNSVTSIERDVFAWCERLTSITLPNSITSIGSYAFNNCSRLTSVIIPNSVKSIGYGAFEECSGLTSVIIPNSVKSIGYGTFIACTGLTSVTIPNSVTSIGTSAFEGCSGLIEIYSLNPTPQSIETSTFENVDKVNTIVYVPAESVEAYKAADGWKDFSNILPIIELITNIELSDNSLALKTKETHKLTATITPKNATDQSVTWSSSNDKVATVSAEGVVTAIAAGEAVITATAADGSGVKASCTVTVTSTVEPDPNNILSIADVQTKVGNTILIPVSLTNEVDVYGLQCDIYLSSSDISLTVDTRGRYVFKQNADRVDGQTASSKLQADGAVRYMIADYTAENPFYENEGELFYISVDIPENAADEYSVTLKNITLATDKEKILCPEITSKITVQKYTLADVDDDGVIDVQDVLRTAQLVLNSGYNIAADMDEDGLIDVQDVIMVARAVLEQTNNAPAMITPPAAKASGKNVFTDYLAIEAADNGSLAISLNNSDEYYGFQMDIELPEGYSFVKDGNGNAEISLNDAKLSEFTVMQNMFANNKMRVLAFSDAQNTIMQNIGELFNVKVRKDNERFGNTCEVRISNIVFSHDMGKVKLSGLTESVLVDDATGIETMQDAECRMQNVYTIDGKKVKTAVRNSINIINGKKTIIK